jgi:hypothetical protein
MNTLKFLIKLTKQFPNSRILIVNLKKDGIFLKTWIKKIIIYAINRLYRYSLL